MWYLDKDILFLILEEIRNNKKTLYSCLLVNRTWCVAAVPLLWRNPWDSYNFKPLLDVILSYLSEEWRDILKNQGINNLIAETYQQPLFNYIDFLKYLDLYFLEKTISSFKIEESKQIIIKNEILKLFCNSNATFNHLSIPRNISNYQLHLITGAERCLSELEFLHCNVDQNVLKDLASICKSIKTLKVDIYYCADNSGIIKLIEVQKNLHDVSFIGIHYDSSQKKINDESFYKSLEESLIKHADTIQYLKIDWIPITGFLSYLVNLSILEICNGWNDINYFENLSSPNLKILNVNQVPPKILTNLVKNTIGQLTEISISSVDNKMVIQVIYQNCPNLKYLHLSLANNNSLTDSSLFILEIEYLLINCQCLKGLIINTCFAVFRWDQFFMILARSSPVSLFRFKFIFSGTVKLEDLKLFFDKWEDRNPMLLTINNLQCSKMQMEDLIKQYKVRGTIKKCSIDRNFISYQNFDWA
ncbi:hypothetical protein C1646_680881 [Rhizophagus diaphanus]|nr:hypothetical protein C1646_680881 [Rhizophagus diaphanus] [Rhizophagus sp. MUCL 43196]